MHGWTGFIVSIAGRIGYGSKRRDVSFATNACVGLCYQCFGEVNRFFPSKSESQIEYGSKPMDVAFATNVCVGPCSQCFGKVNELFPSKGES